MSDKITERPILFSSEMVRAILDDRKTETRRVVKPQPEKDYIWRFHNDGLYQHIYGHYKMPSSSFGEKYFKCPYGGHGDILYVREAFYVDVVCDGGFPFGSVRDVYYRADCDEVKCKAYKWQPSIHMLKKYSRIKLKIKEIRVERVQEITEVDAEREGLKSAMIVNCVPYTSKDGFEYLWDSLNKKRGFGWDTNCFVWVIKFERIK